MDGSVAVCSDLAPVKALVDGAVAYAADGATAGGKEVTPPELFFVPPTPFGSAASAPVDADPAVSPAFMLGDDSTCEADRRSGVVPLRVAPMGTDTGLQAP